MRIFYAQGVEKGLEEVPPIDALFECISENPLVSIKPLIRADFFSVL